MLTEDVTHWQNLDRSHREEMRSKLLSVASGPSPLENVAQLISAVVIIFEHSFYVFDKQRYLQDKRESVPSFRIALEQYIASPHAAVVREGVSAAVQAYEDPVTAAAHAYEEGVTAASRAYEDAMTTAAHAYKEDVGSLPAWRVKLPFGRFKKAKEAFERSRGKEKEALCSQAKVELTKTILEITLNHRLQRP
ncbi:uncharacterized protein BJ212DRAFT_1485854 [Suillus subaureus]|uniref:Uncharacterized protein n=1 Tax=Suillus subaureus TaxID=48587 RepID=A0A9P7DZB0_9AGAM|nr:uncharacterized protein BJ212DRAFT_1485854 [Suillus subaureus]KAG1806989.1 hypothetical protein BJ212DRAFT_1485854 [Suillus subaureus]